MAKNEVTFISLEDVLGKQDDLLTALKQDTIETAKLGKLPVTQLDNTEYKTIKKDCMSFVKGPNGRMQPDLDDDKLMLEVVIKAVDKDTRSNFTFADKKLLEKLGVTTATQAAEKLLSPGEIFNAAMIVQEISGFGQNAEAQVKDDVKNS
jgi:hypothetical protein